MPRGENKIEGERTQEEKEREEKEKRKVTPHPPPPLDFFHFILFLKSQQKKNSEKMKELLVTICFEVQIHEFRIIKKIGGKRGGSPMRRGGIEREGD